MPGVDLHSFMVMLRDFVVNWWPLLGLTFYCVLLYIFWRMLQLMPRVKPATVMVDPRTAIEWADIAGADEAKAELRRSWSSSATRSASKSSARSCQRACCCTGRRERERRCLRKRSRERVGREVLCAERVGVRRDVRRSRCGANSQALRRGSQARARDHLHRRARRCRRRPEWAQLQPRAGSDAQPAARRARRVLVGRSGRRHGCLEPSPGSRSGAAASGPLRSPDAVAPPDRKGREAILHVHTRGKPLASDVELELIARQTRA